MAEAAPGRIEPDLPAPTGASPAGPSRPASRRRNVTGDAVVGLALVAVFAATLSLGGGASRASFVPLASEVPGVLVGQPAPGIATGAAGPRIRLADLDGRQLDLAAYAGRPIWIIVWKTGCPPCEDEAPDVLASYQAHKGDGLIVLAIDVWDTAAMVRDYERTHQLAYPIGLDPTGAFKDAYGAWGAPIHFFIDRSGLIQNRYFGPVTRDLIEASLRSLF
jgi:thiol-disulfide isomerase/thioredoxin